MQLCRAQLKNGVIQAGILEDGRVRFLNLKSKGLNALSDLLHGENPATTARAAVEEGKGTPLSDLTLLAPIDAQEVWAAGVTYKRSQEARERESAGAARFYDLVYSAERPELFFKATAQRAVGPHARVRIRRDAKWSVPEPELTLVISPSLKIVGYTIGNDMSSRDIEGENPLYLPQAKVYDHSCALGPVITLAEAMPPLDQVQITLTIERSSKHAFTGTTNVSQMKRKPAELVPWLGRDNSFPNGAFLLTGTGIVPPDDFTLNAGDVVHIDITGIGRLTNTVEQGGV